jgi:hypothetical protein
MVLIGLKFQITSTKFQINSKFQLPNDPNEENPIILERAFVLEIGIWILFVIWNLELGI